MSDASESVEAYEERLRSAGERHRQRRRWTGLTIEAAAAIWHVPTTRIRDVEAGLAPPAENCIACQAPGWFYPVDLAVEPVGRTVTRWLCLCTQCARKRDVRGVD